MWLWGCDLHALTCNMWKWDTWVLIDYDENSDAAPSALTNATFSYLAIVLHVRMSTQNALIFQIRSAHVDVLTRDSWFLVADDEKNDAALMTLAILTFSLHARVSQAKSEIGSIREDQVHDIRIHSQMRHLGFWGCFVCNAVLVGGLNCVWDVGVALGWGFGDGRSVGLGACFGLGFGVGFPRSYVLD